MQGLEAGAVLDVCERGRGLPPHRQAQLVLESACPDEHPAGLAALPVGRRDARLLEIRAHTLGDRIELETRCPICGQRMHVDLDSRELLAADADVAGDGDTVTIVVDDIAVEARMPTGADLSESLATGAGEHALLARCVVTATCRGEAVAVDELPEVVTTAVGQRLADADPLADVQLELECPACDHAWLEPFDPASLLWAELMARAPALMRDVHRLAAAHGWSEAEILGLSSWRRAHYLALLDA